MAKRADHIDRINQQQKDAMKQANSQTKGLRQKLFIGLL